MTEKVKKFFISAFMVVYCVTSIGWILTRIVSNSHDLLGKYIYSNRLINYRAGFIRRGLGGEIIFWISHVTGFSLVSVIELTSAIIWSILVFFFVYKFIQKKYPLFILLLPFFIGETILTDQSYFLRQDSLIILIFIAMIYVVRSQIISDKLSFWLINLLFVFGVLFHEAIFFVSFPILLLTLLHKTKSLVKAFFFLLPSLIAFVLCFLLPEKSAPAEMLKLSPEINPEYICCFLSFMQSISIQWQKISETSAFFTLFYFFVWVASVYCVCVNFVKLRFGCCDTSSAVHVDTNLLSKILLIQLCSVLPLFCCALDWGRWIFLWVASSFAYFLLVEEDPFYKIPVLSKLNIAQSRLAGINPLMVFFIAIFIDCPFKLPLRPNMLYSAVFIILRAFKISFEFIFNSFF